MVSTLGLTLAVTRGLSAGHAGVFFATTSLFLLAATVGQLGTNTGLVYFLSRARSWGRTGSIDHVFRMATRPAFAVSLAMAVALLVFAEPVSQVVNPGHVGVSTGYLRAMALFIPLACLENVVLAATRGMGTMRPNVITEQLGRPMLQLVLACLSIAVLADRGLGLAWASAYLPAAVLAGLYWRRCSARYAAADRRRAAPEPAGHEVTAREFWRFTAPRGAAGVAQMAMQRLDIVLVAALAGAVPAAVYTASTRFLVVGQMGQRAISLAVQPRIGEALAVDDLPLAKRLYRVSTSWLMLITWPTYLMFIFFGHQLLTLFGRGYAAGNGVLLLLSSVMLFATGCGMVDMVLNMAGRTSWNLMNVLLSLGTQIGLDVLLIPRLGILGAAIGWAVSIVLANLVPLVQIAVVYGLHPFGRSTVVTTALTLSCFALVPAVGHVVVGPGWGGLAVSAACGCLLYAGALWRFRHVLELTELAKIRRRR